jgi:transposase
VTILAEIGDLSRFESPRQLMAYLGLVPSERSTGESVKRRARLDASAFAHVTDR